MLGDFLDDYADLVEDDQPVDDAIHHVDSAIENLVMIGVAVRRTGKASRRRRAEMLFDPAEYEELRRHLECIILLRPSEAGVQSQLDSSSLTAIQKRLIDGNLRRRHRFVVAQKHSRQLREAEGKGTIRPRPGRKERAPPTKAGFTAASTAEGSLLYAPGRRFTTGESRTQITALAADAEFPMPPRNPSGRLIGKCPCCCQSLPVEETMNPNKWRQHIVEDLCPYTCIIEHCPAPHLLFSTRKDWEAHVKADHKTEWHCPLCENQDLVFPTEGDITDHFKAQHPEDVQNLTLSTLLPWSETQRMGITSCPLCPSFGREDSPEIVSHVLRHVYEFSMRALPWPKPATHDLANPVGQHVLPDNSEDAGRLVRWISIVNSDSVNSDVELQLQLSNLDAISYVGAELEETVDEASYVLDEEYFDDASVDESEKPQGALTEPSKRSSPCTSKIPQRSRVGRQFDTGSPI
ncbi:hypothetical protein GQ53DRAFT_785517 [Thozetella sp. PMI_491]|nr:hypothetical protein GQ53DRAFT_785517 [Thozetella sp. PMI_491]